MDKNCGNCDHSGVIPLVRKFYKISEGIYKAIIAIDSETIAMMSYCTDEINPNNVNIHYVKMSATDGSDIMCAHESSKIEKITEEQWIKETPILSRGIDAFIRNTG